MPRLTKDQKRKTKRKAKAKLSSQQAPRGRQTLKKIARAGQILPNINVDYLDALLFDEEGRLRILNASTYADIPYIELRVWCYKRAIYGLPTTELVGWLRNLIGNRSAIEVGSGNGALGRALNIPRTDSYIQEQPDVFLHYLVSGQPTISYGADVEKLEAVEAIRHYDPQVVIGNWVTHWIDPHKPMPPGGGSVYGLREDRILDHPSVETYIVVGHTQIHAAKPILRRPHKVIQEPWIWSRTGDPSGNALFVWGPWMEFTRQKPRPRMFLRNGDLKRIPPFIQTC